MKLYLSSFPALFTVLLSLSLPTLHAQTPAGTDERPAIQVTPDFTKYEMDMAKAYPDYFTINPASVKIKLVEIKEEPDMSYVKLQEQPHLSRAAGDPCRRFRQGPSPQLLDREMYRAWRGRHLADHQRTERRASWGQCC